MSDKRKILILLTVIVVVVLADVGLVFWDKKESQDSMFSSFTPKIESFHCYKKDDWTKITFNNQDFGEYQKEYYYTFIYDPKDISIRGETKVLYTFTDLSGYQVFNMDTENGFIENLDDKKLQKTYVSNTFSFINFLAYKTKDNPLESYLNALNEEGYICKKN